MRGCWSVRYTKRQGKVINQEREALANEETLREGYLLTMLVELPGTIYLIAAERVCYMCVCARARAGCGGR